MLVSDIRIFNTLTMYHLIFGYINIKFNTKYKLKRTCNFSHDNIARLSIVWCNLGAISILIWSLGRFVSPKQVKTIYIPSLKSLHQY